MNANLFNLAQLPTNSNHVKTLASIPRQLTNSNRVSTLQLTNGDSIGILASITFYFTNSNRVSALVVQLCILRPRQDIQYTPS